MSLSRLSASRGGALGRALACGALAGAAAGCAGEAVSVAPAPMGRVGASIAVLASTGEVVLLPFDNVPLQICQLNQGSMSINQCVQYQGFDFQTVPYKTKGVRSRVSPGN